MDANKYTFVKFGRIEREINIPIQMDWNMYGQDMGIETYQAEVVSKVIGKPYDFEVDRFSHRSNELGQTFLNYSFNFYSGGTLNDPTNWSENYLNQGFSTQEVFYYANNFSNSFFKIDLYDTPEDKTQKNYITIILPTQQGLVMSANMQNTIVNIKKPNMVLDYVGDKEGFFIYWLKSREFLNINTFYMTAKFFNAKKNTFVKMMNKPQSEIIGNKYYFEGIWNYYYKVVLDYTNQTYEVYDTKTNLSVGTNKPIKWYEYINPPDGLL